MPDREDAPQQEGRQEPSDLLDSFIVETEEPEAADAQEPPESPESPEPPASDDPTPPAPGGDVAENAEAPEAPDPLHDRLERAVATFENAANRLRNQPTEQNRKAAEKARGRLDELIEASDLDLEPGKHLRTLADEVRSTTHQLSQHDAALDQRLSAYERQLESQQAYIARMQFEQAHPGLKDRYDDLVQQARTRVADLVGEESGPVPEALLQRLAAREWQAVIHEAAQSAPASSPVSPPAPSVPPKPKATNPIKSKSGAARPQADPDDRLKQVLDSFIMED